MVEPSARSEPLHQERITAMTTIAQYATSHNMQPSEVATLLNVEHDYRDDDILPEESLAVLSGDPDGMAESIAANLNGWGIKYTETSDGFGVGLLSVRIAAERGRSLATILDGANLVGVTSDADKAAALLAFPLARKAWQAGYTGDFEIDVLDGFLDMRLSYGSDDVTIHAPIDSDLEFAVVEHPLFLENVDMADLEAVLESTQLAYQGPAEAWQVLCNAADFEQDDWTTLVGRFHWRARFDHGDRLTKVSTSESDNVALVEDYDPESPIRVIDVDAVSDVTCWSHGDAAAAVLYAIS
jgi:hypothetical protein|nr:MAG TPA: hypothetical protein [Bacteriophage sp.]